LKSLRNGKRYTGYTSKNVEDRLSEHNRGCNKWSGENKPFTILYKEYFETKTEAIKRERFLKSGQGRKWLDENIGKI